MTARPYIYIYIYMSARLIYIYIYIHTYMRPVRPGLHNKIPAYNIFARGWVAQEPLGS